MILASSTVASQQHFETRRRMVSPIAIGLSPSPAFASAVRGVPATKGANSRGARPATKWFARLVRLVRAPSLTALLGHDRISLKNWGRVPEAPAAEPVGKT